MAQRKAGRPIRFNAATAAGICARLAAGETLREICRDRALPAEAVVRGWTIDRPPFAAAYRRARQIGYATLADQLLEIADDSSDDRRIDDKGRMRTDAEAIQRSRLRIETRKWLLARTLPHDWGDKTETAKGGMGRLSLRALVLASIEIEAGPDR